MNEHIQIARVIYSHLSVAQVLLHPKYPNYILKSGLVCFEVHNVFHSWKDKEIYIVKVYF